MFCLSLATIDYEKFPLLYTKLFSTYFSHSCEKIKKVNVSRSRWNKKANCSLSPNEGFA